MRFSCLLLASWCICSRNAVSVLLHNDVSQIHLVVLVTAAPTQPTVTEATDVATLTVAVAVPVVIVVIAIIVIIVVYFVIRGRLSRRQR